MQEQTRPQGTNPPSRRQQVGIDSYPNTNQNSSRRTNSQAIISNKIENIQKSGSQAAASLGISERVKNPIPTLSDAEIIENGSNHHQRSFALENEEIKEWSDPSSSNFESEDTYVSDTDKINEDDDRSYSNVTPMSNPDKSLLRLHPILRKIRQEFGIETVPSVTVEIGSVKWTMAPLNQEMLGYALRMADSLSASISEHTVKLMIARAACSVVAIDGIPIYKIFNVKLEKDEKILNYVNPPSRVRKLCANNVYDLVALDTVSSLGRMLADEYEEKLESKTETTIDNKVKATYVCPKCGKEEKLEERFTEGGERIPYFCRDDGSLMNPAMTSEEASNSPLE